MESKIAPLPGTKAALTSTASPKARFLAEPKFVKEHREMLDSEAFSRGCDAALLQYQLLMAEKSTDGNTAMATGFRLQGASDIIMILKSISESAPAVAKRPTDNLNHG